MNDFDKEFQETKKRIEANRIRVAKEIEREMNVRIAVGIVVLVGSIGFLIFLTWVVVKLLQFWGVI